MQTFCVMCRGEIPENRQARGSHFCSTNPCHNEYRKQRRSEKAKKACRLCGRGMPKKSKLEPVRSEHKGTQEATA